MFGPISIIFDRNFLSIKETKTKRMEGTGSTALEIYFYTYVLDHHTTGDTWHLFCNCNSVLVLFTDVAGTNVIVY